VVYDSTSPLFWEGYHRKRERRLNSMENSLKSLKDDKGASVVEYALLVALITVVIVGAVTLLGGNLKATFDYIASIFVKP
jgi:pilus assembly protein Flp/PilA